jgi:hypothetical protein
MGNFGGPAGAMGGAQGGLFGGGPLRMVGDYGEELADLIRQTIAPQSWDVNGGNGVIVYFAPRRALVVRQQGEVHWALEDVVQQLRRN